ncbi:hypothetical protein BJ546DRAFT_1050007 [Cryomyces antarcticus]
MGTLLMRQPPEHGSSSLVSRQGQRPITFTAHFPLANLPLVPTLSSITICAILADDEPLPAVLYVHPKVSLLSKGHATSVLKPVCDYLSSPSVSSTRIEGKAGLGALSTHGSASTTGHLLVNNVIPDSVMLEFIHRGRYQGNPRRPARFLNHFTIGCEKISPAAMKRRSVFTQEGSQGCCSRPNLLDWWASRGNSNISQCFTCLFQPLRLLLVTSGETTAKPDDVAAAAKVNTISSSSPLLGISISLNLSCGTSARKLCRFRKHPAETSSVDSRCSSGSLQSSQPTKARFRPRPIRHRRTAAGDDSLPIGEQTMELKRPASIHCISTSSS